MYCEFVFLYPKICNFITCRKKVIEMFVFPAFITPVVAIGVLLRLIVIPVVLVLLVVWHVKKLNRIDRTLLEILEKLKNN